MRLEVLQLPCCSQIAANRLLHYEKEGGAPGEANTESVAAADVHPYIDFETNDVAMKSNISLLVAVKTAHETMVRAVITLCCMSYHICLNVTHVCSLNWKRASRVWAIPRF